MTGRHRVLRALGPLVVALLCAIGLAVVAPPAAAQTPVTVTVTVMRFIQDQAPDPFGDPGDYKAGVCWEDATGAVACNVRSPNTFLQNHETTPVFRDGTPDVSPFWTLTRTFDRDVRPTARFALLIWDHDPSANAPDDVMDINPTNDMVTLSFAVDLSTGDWVETSTPTGSIPANTGFARGDGDTESNPGWQGPGGEAGRVLFDISLSNDGDGDDDGIPDGLERTAVRDAQGTVVADLAALGADPCRKTVLVEADYMQSAAVGHSHRPKAAALEEVRRAFDDAAMVPARSGCPYAPAGTVPRPGINLVVDVDDAVPEQSTLGTSLDTACTQGLPTVRDTAGFFDLGRRPYFHYSLWAHDLGPGLTNSGLQCGGGRDLIVSLGSWAKTCVTPGADGILSTMPAGDDVVVGNRIDNGPDRTCQSTAVATDVQFIPVGTGPADDSVGTVRQQSASFMHELGHALGLGHGGPYATDTTGNAEFNYKPDYLSVMNYSFSATGLFRRTGGVVTSRLDYSTTALPTLTETTLDETTPLGAGDDLTAWFDPTGRLRFARVAGPIDWDFDTAGAPPFEPSVPVDVNGSRRCVGAGAGALSTAPAAMSDDTINGAGNAVVAGPDSTCQTLTPAAGDTRLVEPTRPCVARGSDGVLTVPVTVLDDKRVADRWIAMDANGTCDTPALPLVDVQSTPLGTSEPTVPLTGAVDWTSLDFSAGLGGVGQPVPTPPAGPEITVDEAVRIESFWRDAGTVPGVSVPAQVPLLGPVPVTFTEPVEAVAPDNVSLVLAGASTPLPTALECRDRAGGTVGCASPSVGAVWLHPLSPLVPGEHYEVRVDPPGAARPVTDPAGNPVPATAIAVRGSLDEPERSAGADYEWQAVPDAAAAGGSYTRDHLAGASASYLFSGSAITWYTVTGPDQGAARVLVDGQLVGIVDQYDVTTSYQVPRTLAGFSPGPHTLTIEVTGLAKPAATDTMVTIDAFGVGEFVDDSPDAGYTWQPNAAFEDPGSSEYVRSDLAGSRAAFAFRGTGVTLWTVSGPANGQFELLLDGKPAGVHDSYAPGTTPGVPVALTHLSDTVHTLTVVVTGTADPASAGTFIAVDGWSVQ